MSIKNKQKKNKNKERGHLMLGQQTRSALNFQFMQIDL